MSEQKKFYITTPIYYPSDKLHIGHSYTTVACDALARFKRMQGYDVMFLTGTDEHGQKIEDKAASAGMQPKEYVDQIVATVKDLWKLLDVSYDRFIRTTDDYHIQSCQKIFTQLYEQGDKARQGRELFASFPLCKQKGGNHSPCLNRKSSTSPPPSTTPATSCTSATATPPWPVTHWPASSGCRGTM